KELDAIEKKFPLRKPMVVVAHSMGGSITHTLLTDAGTTLWLEAFGHPPAETEMDPKNKHLLEEVLIFNHRHDIGRVVFMSTPNRSDGVVAYWSSHLDGAKSERIVPSGHGSPLNPQAIAEVHRILQLNAASN